MLVDVRPIAVADLVAFSGQGPRAGGPPGSGASPSDPLGLGLRGAGGAVGAAASATSFAVQTFLNNVVMVATHGQSSQELRNSVAGAGGSVCWLRGVAGGR